MAKTKKLELSINEAFERLRDAEIALTRATEGREQIHDERASTKAEHGLRAGAVASLQEEIDELTARLDQLAPQMEELGERITTAKAEADAIYKELRALKKAELTLKAIQDGIARISAQNAIMLEASNALANLQAEERFIKERIDSLRNEHSEESKQAAALGEVVARLDEQEAEADGDVAMRGDDLNQALVKLHEALGNTGGQPIDESLLDLIATSGRTPRTDFLTLDAPGGTFDDLAEKALERFGQKVAPPDVVKQARDHLVRLGIASDISKVTKRLRRTRLSRIRRAVLAKAYVPLLMSRLGGRRIDPNIAEDTVGLADSILHDLDAEGGPIERYARLLTDMTVEAMRLDAGAGTPARQLIEVQIRSSI